MHNLLQMPFLFADSAEPAHIEGNTARVPDASEREQALDIHTSWIVEAPAGSGKTGLLIQRFLKLLAEGQVDEPGEVLAITFTRKAGAEMRGRVVAELSAAAEGQSLPASANPFARRTREAAHAALKHGTARGWHLLEDPKSLNIRTIDSLCALIAASSPLLAGSAARYAPTDDPEPLYEEAATRTILRMDGSDPLITRDLETVLLHRDANPRDVSRLLAGMLRQREQWGDLLPLDPVQLTDDALETVVRPKLTRTLERLIAQELETAAKSLGEPALQRLATLAHALSSCPGYKNNPSPLAACAQRPSAPGTQASDLEHWKCLIDIILNGDGKIRSGFNPNHLGFYPPESGKLELQAVAGDLRDRTGLLQSLKSVRDLPSGSYPEDAWRIVRSLCRVLRLATFELQCVFSERRTCDFSEVAHIARNLLRAAPSGSLRASMGNPKHLLVDELQDTSAAQFDLLRALTHRWNGASQTVFLVGDPKQSIYEFRQARVQRFLRLMQTGRLGDVPLGALRLTSNFRSQGSLVRDFNNTFSQLLPAPEDLARSPDAVDVPFLAAHPTRPAIDGPALHWHFTDPEPNAAAPNADPTAVAARNLREVIERFLSKERSSSRGAPKVAVLARNRSHFAPIIREFQRDHGAGPLAFRAVGIEALNERPEVLDLLSLTRALLHPGDRVAWLALLHSPVCGLGLADLLALTGEGVEAHPEATVPHLIVHRGHLLSPGGRTRLERAWFVLHQALEDLDRTPLPTHVERSWRSLGFDLALDSNERANAYRFLDLLHEANAGPAPLSITQLNRRMRKLYAEPNPAGAAVELMTIHAAKGLEWDLVLVPALHRTSDRYAHGFLEWLEFDTDGSSAHPSDLLLAPIQSKGEKPSDLSRLLTRRRCDRETAEAKRLFYVACTRAREEVHLFANVSRKADGNLVNPNGNSLLKAAWPVAEPVALSQLSRPEVTGKLVAFPPISPLTPATETLAIAAAAGNTKPERTGHAPSTRSLPSDINPSDRFQAAAVPLFSYPSATTLRREATFARPEGSFAARAFGNVVHRLLWKLAARLAGGTSLSALKAELASWAPRIANNLRAEGLSPSQATAEARRALHALLTTLSDSNGAWLLAPHVQARDEALLGTGASLLRADRTFLAGPEPLTTAAGTHLWIVDYKTAELGGRSLHSFLAAQRREYAAQMAAYAEAAATACHPLERMILALYFPLLPALVHWSPVSERVPETVTFV